MFYSETSRRAKTFLRCPRCGEPLVYEAKKWSGDHGTVHYTARLACPYHLTVTNADGKTPQEAEENLIKKL